LPLWERPLFLPQGMTLFGWEMQVRSQYNKRKKFGIVKPAGTFFGGAI